MTEITAEAIRRAIQWDMCLHCGEKLGKFRAQIVTPTGALTLRADRPQSHQRCLEEQIREEKGTLIVWLTRTRSMPGMIPGTAQIAAFQLPTADALMWYTDGRPTYRDEAVLEIKRSVLPLIEACNTQEEFNALGLRVRNLVPTLPRNSSPAVSACLRCKTMTDDLGVIECTDFECPLFEVADEPESAA